MKAVECKYCGKGYMIFFVEGITFPEQDCPHCQHLTKERNKMERITSANYVEKVLRSESPISKEMLERFTSFENIRLMHVGMGMQTEAAEFTDMLKKSMFYGKPLDKVNLREELGDLLWYAALGADILGTTLDELMTTNIEKLSARYPEKFTEFHAENRDLETERKILEK